jgi:hypothetical protein
MKKQGLLLFSLTLIIIFAVSGCGLINQPLTESRSTTSSGIIKGPYSMSPTTDSVTIMWETTDGMESTVFYGTDGNFDYVENCLDGWEIPGEGVMHEVTLTGLDPFTEYTYQVKTGSYASSDSTTKTAPLSGTDFKLLIGGDSRSGSRFWRAIANMAQNMDIDMAVHLGDMVDEGYDRTNWQKQFFDPAREAFQKYPLISAVGDHEGSHGDDNKYYEYLSLPVHHPPDSNNPEAYYSLDYGDVKIISFDSTMEVFDYETGSDALTWLENEINSCTSKWLFFLGHEVIIGTGTYGANKDTWDPRTYLMPLFEEYAARGGNIVVFNGDDHNFEHLYKDGVHYFRPAGMGVGLYRQSAQALADNGEYSLFFAKKLNYAIVEIKDNGNLFDINIYTPPDKLLYTYQIKLDD